MDQLYLLPTSKVAAAKGFAEFTFLFKQFPQSARQLFIGAAASRPHYTKFIDVRRCVAGVSAEIAFEMYIIEAFPRDAFTQAEHIINTQAEHFFFYHKERTPAYNWEEYSFFNLLAVQQVARNYPAYFPVEAVTKTREWLQQYWQLWADGRGMNCLRYGLLSGFPLEAAREFSRDKKAEGKIPAFSDRTHLSYFGVNPEKDTVYIQQLDEIFLSINCWDAL